MARLRKTLIPTLIFAAFLVVWDLSSGRLMPAWALSDPLSVWRGLLDFIGSGSYWPHVKATGTAILFGYPLGVVVGVLLGYLLGRYRWLGESLEALVIGIKGIPTLALAPIFIMWFGIGITSKVALVIYISFFFNFFNTYAGVRYLDQDMINYAQLLGAKGTTVTFRVVLPAISPSIITGIRVSGPLAVTGAIVGEYIAARAGLGHFVRESSQMLDMTNVFVGVVFLVVFVQIMNVITRTLEGRLLRWMPRRETGGAPRN